MESVKEWISSLSFPFSFGPKKQSHNKTIRNKYFKRTSSIPVVEVGKKRRAQTTITELSDFPPRKKSITASPFSIHYRTSSNTPQNSSIPQQSTLRTPKQTNSFSISPRKITASPLPEVMQSTKEPQIQEIIILSSDDEEENDLFREQPQETDYAFEVAKAIELGNRQNEEYFGLSPLADPEDAEDSEEEYIDPDPYSEGEDLLFAITGRQRAKFERKKAKKLERIVKSRSLLSQRAEEYERERAQKRAERDRTRPLSTEELEAVEKILYEGSNGDTIVDDITRKDLRTMRDGEWLNDVVINAYLAMITTRSKDNPQSYAKVHHMTTYFYSTLTRTGKFDYSRVRRWTSKVDLFAMDKILVPIHLGTHWTLAVIQVSRFHVDYFDSLGGSHRCVEDLKRYMREEHKDKKGKELKGSWTHKYHSDIPHQRNGYDCGVFTCRFAECQARKSDFDFTQKQMPYFRLRMVLEIVNKKIAL